MRLISRRFLRGRSGNFAVIAALAMVPVIGAMGAAVDLSRAARAKNLFQNRADEAALAVAHDGPLKPDMSMYQSIRAQLTTEAPLNDVQMSGSWTAVNEYTVTVSGNLPLTLVSVIPGVGNSTRVEATATARFRDVQLEYKPPTLALLDPEAGDYNRIYAYCYDASRKKEADKGRTKEVAVADNGGTTYKNAFPKCEGEQTLSYRLYNVRGSRGTKSNWDKAGVEKYDYYTDTDQPFQKPETYSPASTIMLETVLCQNEAQCKPKPAGIIPTGRYRTPEKATESCAPGKFMYYGWEDRPPASGDRDYDDIRLIIECPTTTITGSKTVRLVH